MSVVRCVRCLMERRATTCLWSLACPCWHAFHSRRAPSRRRWEYLQGSTVFLVWNGSKTRFDPTGQFSPGRDFGDLLSADSDNVFLVKVNYYLNP